MRMNFSSEPKSAGESIQVDFSAVSVNIKVGKSSVGRLPSEIVAIINPLVDTVLKDLIVPQMNKKFPGIPIPSTIGEKIKNVVIQSASRKVVVYADVDINIGDNGNRVASLGAPPLPPHFYGAGFVGSVAQDGLQKWLAQVMPTIVKQVNQIQIPSMSGKQSGIDYKVDGTRIQGFSVGSSSIKFLPGRGVGATLSSVTVTIPSTKFSIWKWLIAKIQCNGHFSGSVNVDANIVANITASQDGKPHLAASVDWNWGSLKVSAKVDGSFCKVVKDIAQFFVGDINKKIEDTIKKLVPSTVDQIINSQVNSALDNLVLTKVLDKYAAVQFYMTSNPQVSGNSLTIFL